MPSVELRSQFLHGLGVDGVGGKVLCLQRILRQIVEFIRPLSLGLINKFVLQIIPVPTLLEQNQLVVAFWCFGFA